jgi:hypothetical protein
MWGEGVEAASPDVLRERLRTPDGFSVSLWSDDLSNARFLRFTPAGDLLVSEPRRGRVTLSSATATAMAGPTAVTSCSTTSTARTGSTFTMAGSSRRTREPPRGRAPAPVRRQRTACRYRPGDTPTTRAKCRVR